MTASVDKIPTPEDTFETSPTREAIAQHEGTAVVRRILWKLDIQFVFSFLSCRPMSELRVS
jgi:hypothetical protein